jgi:hypothetical protein
MRLEGPHCAALRIDAEAGLFVCTIYEHRPDACRDLARESPQCAGERSIKADRADQRLLQLRRTPA